MKSEREREKRYAQHTVTIIVQSIIIIDAAITH